VLIFSMSKKNLDLIEQIILSGYLGKDSDGDHVKYMRIDGNTEISEREAMCNDFNKDTK
jgi:SNF2 family DNA or RNA helicase